MQYDIILVSGDLYFDYPMSGTAIIRRLLEDKGYSVAVIDMPDIKKKESFTKYGEPKLFFAVSSGSMDSMLSNYTPMKRRRTNAWLPDRAVIVYCNKLREHFKGCKLVIAGVEAAARRLAHYDYMDNKVRRSILLDSRAEILAYGMAERQILEIAERFKDGKENSGGIDLKGIRGTAIIEKTLDYYDSEETVVLPGFDEVSAQTTKSKENFSHSFMLQYSNKDPFSAKTLAEPYPNCFVVQNPPALPLTTEELDYVYSLPFTRVLPQKFKNDEMMKSLQFSVATHRGCFGGCSFCSIGFLHGKIIQSRSEESILNEIRMLTKHKDFKGIIYDLGGPSANMYGMRCRLAKGNDKIAFRSIKDGKTREMMFNAKLACRKECLPGPCSNLDSSPVRLTALMKHARKIPGVKKVFVHSGVRYDLISIDREGEQYLEELLGYHISGQLKVAPEHVDEQVLKLMNKPGIKSFEDFKRRYELMNFRLGLKQYLVPYLVIAHPGSGMKEAKELADYIKHNHIAVEQVQVFTPTPMSMSTCMYYTGIDPKTKERVYIPYSYNEKKEQKRLLPGMQKMQERDD
jgi:uncharacterized radical SAM protein YgiQ